LFRALRICALLIGALGVLAGAKTAHAEGADPQPSEAMPSTGWLSKWTIDRDHPEANIPSEKDRNGDPLQFGYWLQDLIWKAEHAAKVGDHAQAAKFYAALAVAIPDRSSGFTLACQEYEAMGEIDRAINACGQGLFRDGVKVKDYTHFVHLVLAKPQLSPQEKEAVGRVLAHMRQDPTGSDFVDDLECEVGVHTSNVAQLRECTAGLASRGADASSRLLAFQWNLAVQEHKFGLARDLAERAKGAGVPPEKVLEMLKVTKAREQVYWLRVAVEILGLALVCVGIGAAARAIRRRRASSGPGGATAAPPVEKAPVPG
jgi:hypothetical protein